MPPLIPRRDLFGNPTRASTQISPDGRHLSWLAPDAGVLNIWIAPVDAPADTRVLTADRGRGIRSYGWTYAGPLVYLQDVDGNEDFHLYAIDPSGGERRDLTPFPGARAGIAGISRVVRDRILIALNRRDPRLFDLFTLDPVTGALGLVAENPGFAGFVADDHYRPRLAVRLDAAGAMEVLRHGPDEDWAPWLRFDAEDARTSGLSHLSRNGGTLYLRDSRGRDTAALARLDLATGETTILAEDPRADIGGVLSDIDTGAPLACSVTVERTEHIALDPAIRADLDFLDAQGIGDWGLNGRSEDDRLWVVGGGSDRVAGAAYLYDRSARTLRKLHDTRPALADAPLVAMTPVTLRSRDGLSLVSYLSRPIGASGPGSMVLLVHGGPWARDGFGFNPMHQWLANRGHAVLSVNFRGSTGFGKRFVNAGDGEWGRRMDDDLLDAVAWAVDQRIADPARIGIMGGSYGGYAVLSALTRAPDVFACGVDIVGPSNIETLIGTIPPYWESVRSQLVRAVGDPATEAGRTLMRARSPLHRADRIRAPLLIAQGANDPRVKQAESDQMVAAMQANGVPVAYVLFPDEGHGFARPENAICFNAVAEQFLARHLGGRTEPMTEAERAGSTMRVLAGADMLGLKENAP